MLAIKVLFRINKTRFPRVNARIGDLFPFQKADLYDVISLKYNSYLPKILYLSYFCANN